MFERSGGRGPRDERPVTIEIDVLKHAEGSALISFGDTRVLCAASVEPRIPSWLRGSNSGWVTAEYGMLPRATNTRNDREAVRGRQGGRTQEIQRLIGRSLRAAVNLEQLGEQTITLDCDVIQADGGTRTASITGAYVALALALHKLMEAGSLKMFPMRSAVAAISCGLNDDIPLLDLNYEEDSSASVDFNVVMTEEGEFVEVQGTGESHPFSRDAMNELFDLADGGIRQLFEMQRAVLAEAGAPIPSQASS